MQHTRDQCFAFELLTVKSLNELDCQTFVIGCNGFSELLDYGLMPFLLWQPEGAVFLAKSYSCLELNLTVKPAV